MVEIKLQNVHISGNAKFFNNMRISGTNSVRIEMSNVTVKDNPNKKKRPNKR